MWVEYEGNWESMRVVEEQILEYIKVDKSKLLWILGRLRLNMSLGGEYDLEC